MSDASLSSTISPEGALSILRELLPERMVPAAPTLLAQCRKGHGPPSVLVTEGVPGPGRVRFNPEAVRGWCLAQQPPRVEVAIRLLGIAEEAAVLDLETVPDAGDGLRGVGVSITDADAVLYEGHLDGAEIWLRDEAAARAEAEGGGS